MVGGCWWLGVLVVGGDGGSGDRMCWEMVSSASFSICRGGEMQLTLEAAPLKRGPCRGCWQAG